MNEERKNHLHKQSVAEHAFFWPVRTIQETLSAQRVISHLKRKSQKPSIHADYWPLNSWCERRDLNPRSRN